MVGILADEMTGPAFQMISIICVQGDGQHTRKISVNGCLHERLHPFANHSMLVGGKRMRLVHIVNNPESVSPRVDCIVRNHFVAVNIDISLHLGLLFTQTHISFPEPKAEAKGTHRLRAQVIHMRTFEIKESHLPCIVPLPFLHYPPGEVCLTQRLQQLGKGIHARLELDSSPAPALPLGPAAETDIGAGRFIAPSVSGDSGIGLLFVLFLSTDGSLSLALAVLGLGGRKSP